MLGIRNSTETDPTMDPNPWFKRKLASCSLLISVHRLSTCVFTHAELMICVLNSVCRSHGTRSKCAMLARLLIGQQ